MEASEGQSSQHTKRVVLPSGRTIEVVYFDEAAPVAASPEAGRTPTPRPVERDQALHFCNSCGSNLVYPISWEEAGEGTWAVALRCPECEERREGVFSQASVEVFDEELDLGTDALTSDYRRLCRANLAEEIDRFVAALEAGAILPEDF